LHVFVRVVGEASYGVDQLPGAIGAVREGDQAAGQQGEEIMSVILFYGID
jgi:hypothetical protein